MLLVSHCCGYTWDSQVSVYRTIGPTLGSLFRVFSIGLVKVCSAEYAFLKTEIRLLL